MIRRLIFPALAAAVAGAPPPAPARTLPRYTVEGALLRPAEVERWILVGASLGLGYSDATDDGPGMFHRVYLEPTAYEPLPPDRPLPRRHDARPLDPAAHAPVPPSRAGWTEGELAALELAVKDPARFRGEWAYFDFGRDAPGTTSSCSSIRSFGTVDRGFLASCRVLRRTVCYREAQPHPA